MSGSVSTYKRALLEVRPYWPKIALVLLFGLLWTPLALLAPLPLKIIVDNVVGPHPYPAWLGYFLPVATLQSKETLALVMVVATIAIAAVTFCHNILDWLIRETIDDRITQDIRARLLSHSLRLCEPSASPDNPDDVYYRMVHDAPALVWTTVYGLTPLIISSVSLVFILAVTAKLSVMVAAVALLTSLPMIALIHMSQQKMCRRWHEVKELDSSTLSIAHEALGAMEVVAAFGQEEREVRRYLRKAGELLRTRLRVLGIQSCYTGLMSLSAGLGTAATLYLAIGQVLGGSMSVGALVLVMTYMAQLYAPLNQIGSHISNQQAALASVQRAFSLLSRMPPVADPPTPKPLGRVAGAVAFDRVGFAFSGRNPLLGDFSLSIPAGAKVGIVGPTGSGKSTILNLLWRQFDPVEGRILLDGVDIRDHRLADLRKHIAVVGQDNKLFSGTIADNISYGCCEASREGVVEAARAAGAHDFISKLPLGYDTQVGARGMQLSGGERQRIALARAYLKNAALLLLDEPTSALDATTEGAVLRSLREVMRGRTTILVTHRLSALSDMDTVLELSGGRLQPVAAAPQPGFNIGALLGAARASQDADGLQMPAPANAADRRHLPLFVRGHSYERTACPAAPMP